MIGTRRRGLTNPEGIGQEGNIRQIATRGDRAHQHTGTAWLCTCSQDHLLTRHKIRDGEVLAVLIGTW